MTQDLPTISFSASLSRKLQEAAELLKSHKGTVRIISHYDPDGISAAALGCKMVRRIGLGFHATLNKKLDDTIVQQIRETTPEDQLIIFSDMGSAKVSLLDEFPHRVIVVDHHQPEKEGDNIIHLNPHLFEIDGAREASGSSFYLALAITIDEANWDLAGLALAGACGDRQSLGGYKGYNEELVQAAAARELLKMETVPNLKGQTIYDSLIEWPEPYFTGITGRKRESSRFLRWLGLGKESLIGELDREKRRFLTSACALRLLRQGATPDAVGNLVMTRYWLYDWGMYADELSALLNSCSRQGEHGLGLALALGDADAKEKAMEHSRKHRDYIITQLRELEANPPEKLEHLQHFMVDEPSYAGVLAGLGTLYFFDSGKATFGMSDRDDSLNVSARAPRELVNLGVNLGTACRLAGEKVGGTGGGHDIAAGATVPSNKKSAFLSELDKIIAQQIGS